MGQNNMLRFTALTHMCEWQLSSAPECGNENKFVSSKQVASDEVGGVSDLLGRL
jgi:hypothetical protein